MSTVQVKKVCNTHMGTSRAFSYAIHHVNYMVKLCCDIAFIKEIDSDLYLLVPCHKRLILFLFHNLKDM